MKNFSEEDRAEAVLILDIAASHASGLWYMHETVLNICQDAGASSVVIDLVYEAYLAVGTACGIQERGDAAGLLREGWCPGDRVRLLRRGR